MVEKGTRVQTIQSANSNNKLLSIFMGSIVRVEGHISNDHFRREDCRDKFYIKI
jgi:hypothetical protein